MKQIKNLYLLLWMITMACLPSCTDDLGTDENRSIKEGVPVNVHLDFNVGQSSQVTRIAGSAEAERTVNTLNVFVFDSDGTLDAKFQFDINGTDGKGKVPEMRVHSGRDKHIYAVANAESGAGTLTIEQLDAVQTEEQLLAVTSKLENPINVERTYFLMSGKLETSDGSSQIDISEDGTVLGSDGVIRLRRVDARITFRVKGETSNPNYTDFVFTPDRYWVEQIPQGTYVFGQSTDYEEAGYASMSAQDHTVIFEGEDVDGFNSFEFYMAENRLTPKVRIESSDGEAESLYAMREKREKTTIPEEGRDPNKPGQTEEDGAFKYANDHSTYVRFRGVLSYTDNTIADQPKFVNANVVYTVHLGNTGTLKDANDPDRVNNYDTERNTHYTYTVTVTGIHSLEVEVKEEREERPGVEGDVIIAGAEVKSMDSHYGRAHFTLRRGDIKNGLSWAINTPFQRGMKVFVPDNHKDTDGRITENLPEEKMKTLQTDLSLNDYKWVQFVINKEALKAGSGTVGNDEFAKYPGYAAYDGGSGVDSPAPAFGGEGYYYSGRTAYYREKVVLYDVNQLINHLYVEANDENSTIFEDAHTGNPDDDTVAITAFVDEYIYIYDPTKIYYKDPLAAKPSDAEIDLTLWKRVVNGSERMLHFCTSRNIYSPDGNTSLAESVITFSQKPIYSFYDTNSDVTTAWGTECMMETDRLRTEHTHLSDKYDNTHGNGRENTLNIIPQRGSLRWSDVLPIDAADWGELKSGYQTIWYACLGRNRDLNGDDIVDADEIRWYLASIDQLTDIWIGQNSLNEEAWLYQGDEADGTNRLHVASSSYYDSNSSYVWVIWAEEGASRGSSNAAAGNEGYAGNKYREYFEYRCVRNLGLSLDDIDRMAEDYVHTSENTYDNGSTTFYEYIIDVSRLESNSLRSSSVTGTGVELPAHDERDGMNRPYKKIAVLRGTSPRDNNRLYPEQNQTWQYFQKNHVCPRGYRTPNQRELMLMYTSLTDENPNGYWMDWSGNYMTYTGFSFNGNSLYYEGNRPGFLYADDNLMLITDDGSSTHTGRVRCVRDVTN